MSTEYTLRLDHPQASLEIVGGKGASLAKLTNAGLPIPGGFHVTTLAYRDFVASNDLQADIMAALERVDVDDVVTLETASQTIRQLFIEGQIPPDVAHDIVAAYATLPGRDPAVAVRSSATAEDLPEASFAGQQDTFLNVSGAAAVLGSVQKCWASLWTARAIGYRLRQRISAEQVALAVVVQMLVPAEAAGIMFTINPITGRRDEILISAAWGLGEAVVGGLVTPDNFVVAKENGSILNQEIGDKQVMTVRINGGTQEQVVPRSLRQVPVLDERSAPTLAGLGREIELLFGMPMDIEWTLADGEFAIVQARPVTALPTQVIDEGEQVTPPTEWPLPDPKGRYVRVSIIDLLPDPLSPLFETLGVPAINRGIGAMSTDMLNFPPDSLSDLMLTINGYAYQKGSYSRRQVWLLLTRMLPGIPRMLRQGVPYWQDVQHPRYVETAARWGAQPLADLSPGQLWHGVGEVLDAFAKHLGALMASTMGPTAGSEGLFTSVYGKLARKPGDPSAPTFLMGYDSIPIKGEKALYDLAMWCKEQPTLARYLAESTAEQVAGQLEQAAPPAGVSDVEWRNWQQRFRLHLERYGYSIYDLDFAKPLPMEQPAPMLATLKMFVAGEGRNPHERQQAYASRREQAVTSVRARLRGPKRWAFEKALKWAQTQAPLREDGIAEIGLGYPILRRMLHELGRRFVAAGAVEAPDDIYWQTDSEVEELVIALERGEVLGDRAEKVRERKMVWQARKRVAPPPMLPPGSKYMGFEIDSFLAGEGAGPDAHTLKGVAASPGQVTAAARVLHGPQDFGQMQPGDILVAGITTPAWTPLFALAAGIVTDIGGPLSHGSIVAREYGIPAVLGTGSATRRVQSGQTITVDGSAGVVTLHTAGQA